MDSKFFVSYEAARLLKEKGYDIKRDFLTPIYKEDGSLYWSNHEDLSDKIPAITKSEAIDWMESKGIVVGVAYHRSFDRYYFGLDYKNGELLPYQTQYELFTTRLEAEEAAIIKALELLK